MARTAIRRKSLKESMSILHGYNSEPIVTEEKYAEELTSALNFYNNVSTEEEMFSYLTYYLKHTPLSRFLPAVECSNYLEIKTIAALARLFSRGQYLSPDDEEKIVQKLELLFEKYVSTNPVPKKEVTKKPNVQDWMNNIAHELMGEIDGEIDDFLTNFQSKFSMKSFLVSKNVSGMIARKIGKFYQKTLDELKEAQEGKDEQLVEGYSHIGKIQMRKYIDFIQTIVNDCAQHLVSVKVPRVKKQKPASVLARKIKPLQECKELNLKSISPEQIVGANEVWMYKPEERKLIVLYAADGCNLSIKSMSVINYDAVRSGTKIVRKPEEFFKKTVLSKKRLNQAWKDIKAKSQPAKHRISTDMMILLVG